MIVKAQNLLEFNHIRWNKTRMYMTIVMDDENLKRQICHHIMTKPLNSHRP